ncbi:hypothetical protein OF83DRAFT_112720 [Amylostereum chailletii]|nr:hypothetical protein OF83DRAFT_112720 [Amylostereum chailletii]
MGPYTPLLSHPILTPHCFTTTAIHPPRISASRSHFFRSTVMERTQQWAKTQALSPAPLPVPSGAARKDLKRAFPPPEWAPHGRNSVIAQTISNRMESSGDDVSSTPSPLDTDSSTETSELSEITDDCEDDEGVMSEPGPDDLDEPWPYTFKASETVWVKVPDGTWHIGKVHGPKTKTGSTRQVCFFSYRPSITRLKSPSIVQKEGLFYPVIYRRQSNFRRYFAPLNGEIKPDTSRTRKLLRDAGYIL